VRRYREVGGGKRTSGIRTPYYLGFTFDDGPDHRTTPAVLDALDKYDIPATFFVVGWRIQGDKTFQKKNRAVLRDIVRRGHMIGNHTFKHRSIKKQSPKAYKAAIDMATSAIEAVIGYRPWWFRPPYGDMKSSATRYVYQEQYTEARWNIDSEDWKTFNGRKLRRQVFDQIKHWKGGIVLFHDTKPITVSNIGQIFKDLRELNCRRIKRGEKPFIPVSLHYFMREKDGTPRPIPPAVAERTERYSKKLRAHCKAAH
jgi:peptidoglycan/xylan/chitin deacetylase (PgdA/CDA1 family)